MTAGQPSASTPSRRPNAAIRPSQVQRDPHQAGRRARKGQRSRADVSEVTVGGNTTVVKSNSCVPACNPPPDGFTVVGSQYWDLHTAADHTGPITVCIHYDPTNLMGDEDDLNLMHDDNDGAGWKVITSSLCKSDGCIAKSETCEECTTPAIICGVGDVVFAVRNHGAVARARHEAARFFGRSRHGHRVRDQHGRRGRGLRRAHRRRRRRWPYLRLLHAAVGIAVPARSDDGHVPHSGHQRKPEQCFVRGLGPVPGVG